MKKILLAIMITVFSLNAQALFEVKDAQDSTVFEISNDGMRVFNLGDTLMVISSSEIKAFIDQNSKDRALSRSFSISTNTTGKDGNANVLEVTTTETTMREGGAGNRYTNFSPENIFIGLNAGILTYPHDGPFGAEFGEDNIFIGNQTGIANNDGFGNIFIGSQCGVNNDSGYQNMFIGNESGASNADGYFNLFIGNHSGGSNISGARNTFVGFHSGASNISGVANTFFGNSASFGSTTGSRNTTMGYEAGQYNNTGSYNSYFGSDAGEKNAGGSYNSIVGAGAGSGVLSSSFSNNSYLGYQSGFSNATGSGNVFLGYQAGYNETLSNKLYIDNSSTATPLIHGDFASDVLTVNGTLKVKTMEIADMGSSNLGLDGDVVPYGGSALGFDLGNNNATEHWDDIVGDDFINYAVKNAKDVKSIEAGLGKIMQLRPVSFTKDRQRFGLIPEEVEKILPEAVISQDIDFDPETKEMKVKVTEKGMVYDQLIPVLIKSIQEQQEIIKKLEVRIIKLENNN
ncbi:MAG: hypothetical protein GQ534_07590 [Candidatus Delongbacteria bacterium]|nr:hypothetical protein [Candidatus Delongbacteria bacterium]